MKSSVIQITFYFILFRSIFVSIFKYFSSWYLLCYLRSHIVWNQFKWEVTLQTAVMVIVIYWLYVVTCLHLLVPFSMLCLCLYRFLPITLHSIFITLSIVTSSSLSLSLSYSLSVYMYTYFLSPSLSLFLFLTLSLFLSISPLSHTHTHTLSLSFSLCLCVSLCCSHLILSYSLHFSYSHPLFLSLFS